MPFGRMIKLKLEFLKSMYNKITKSIFYFSFILELHVTKTVQQSEERKKG